MPTVSKEQIIEMELTLTELLDQLAEVTKERDALKAELMRLRATLEVA